ncbi:MAG: rRNA maturation RNase YbeY [Anaerolineae bacterium]|nr:rRNA maturation RNase YbeY [Anaerolineae bacterium]
MNPEHTILIQLEADFTGENSVQQARLEAAARKVLETEGLAQETMMTIVLCPNAYIQEMNLKYRGIDAPTDVLSFPSPTLPEEVAEEEGGYLGDILISLPYVAQRAAEEGRSLHDDLILMVVHGTLHLLGYDHDTPESQKNMWAVQGSILKSLDVLLEVPDYIHDDQESH